MPLIIQHTATIYNTTKGRSRDYDASTWEQFTSDSSTLDQHNMHPVLCPVYVLDRRMQERTSPPKWTKCTTQKVYVGHLHHYSKSVPMIWDPKTKLVSPQFHGMFDDNYDKVQSPDPNVKHKETMERLFTPNIKICQESLVMTSAYDDHHSATQTNASTENTHNNKLILSMQYLVILHAKKIFPQNNKDDFKSYTHLHGIDMQIHSIPKPPKQKAQDMGLSNLHEEEFKLFAMEYNTTNPEPDSKLYHYVNTLQ
jgi:hypothetical protein